MAKHKSKGMIALHWNNYSHEKAELLYHTPSKWEVKENLWTIRAGQTVTKPGYHVGPKRISGYSIHLVKKGTLLFECGDRKFLLQEGDLFCMFNGRPYSYSRPADCPKLLMSWVVFDGPGTEALLQEVGLTPEKPYISRPFNTTLSSAFDTIFQSMRLASSGQLRHSLALQSAMLAFFSAICSDEVAAAAHHAESPDWIRMSVRYADLHAVEGLSVQQLATLVGMNRNYFSTAFTQHVGMSPSQYLMKVRMARAAEMLLDSTASVSEIAYSIGYANPFVFTRAFTRHFGLPPTSYREHRSIQ